jgi:ABC-2 type transport system permease protein
MNAFITLLRAFAYLQTATIINLIRQRLRRLRQPRYLIGALVGLGYLYVMLFSHRWGATQRETTPDDRTQEALRWMSDPMMHGVMGEIAAFVLLIVLLFAWILPSSRATLRFSEAEIAFLFPAPLTRRMLIHYRLLRSQLGILFSALVVSLISRGIGGDSADFLLHTLGWWLALSTLRLHFIAASFGREWLLDLGVRPWLRRIVAAMAAIALFGATIWWASRQAAPPTIASIEDLRRLPGYAVGVLNTPPLSWALIPLGWLTAPMAANDVSTFLRALPPALALLIAHYIWVLRFDTAFEEASIESARRQAAQMAAAHNGHANGSRLGSQKPRSAAFELAPTGLTYTAFLWKGLIALGSLYRLRVWGIACIVAVLGLSWLARNPALQPLRIVIGACALSLGAWLFIAGPMFMQKNLQRLFEHLDVLKTYPLPGKQLVLGELITPIVVITAAQWLLLLIGGLSLWPSQLDHISTGDFLVILAAMAILSPVLSGLMLCVPFTGMLLFPAWLVSRPGENRGGIEVLGQRLVFFAGYFLVLLLALMPALLLSALAFIALHTFGNSTLALAGAAALAFIVLFVEWQLVVVGLGRRIDQLDISLEQLN